MSVVVEWAEYLTIHMIYLWRDWCVLHYLHSQEIIYIDVICTNKKLKKHFRRIGTVLKNHTDFNERNIFAENVLAKNWTGYSYQLFK